MSSHAERIPASTTIRPARPLSLLQFAGAPLHPSPLDKSTLVLIDMQEEYRIGRLPLEDIDQAIAETTALLRLARDHAMPVFHIVQHGRSGGLFDPASPAIDIIAPLAPRQSEEVVIKSLPNAFAKTSLDTMIRATGRKELIIAGFMTHMCVSATARSALDLGYRSTIIAAATATRPLPDPLGGNIAAADVHRAALAALADRFAIVVPDSAALTTERR